MEDIESTDRTFDVGEDGPVGSLAVHSDGAVYIAFERGSPGTSLWLATTALTARSVLCRPMVLC